VALSQACLGGVVVAATPASRRGDAASVGRIRRLASNATQASPLHQDPEPRFETQPDGGRFSRRAFRCARPILPSRDLRMAPCGGSENWRGGMGGGDEAAARRPSRRRDTPRRRGADVPLAFRHVFSAPPCAGGQRDCDRPTWRGMANSLAMVCHDLFPVTASYRDAPSQRRKFSILARNLLSLGPSSGRAGSKKIVTGTRPPHGASSVHIKTRRRTSPA
jgi:hypothetical protein